MITKHLLYSLLLILVLIPSTLSSTECTQDDHDKPRNSKTALKFKIVAIASILGSGTIGVSLPLVGGHIYEPLRPENDMFFVIKAFAAGVILATGFVHILPDGFDNLTSPCLSTNPWSKFPFAGLVAMIAAIGTLIVDTVAATFYKKNKHSDAGDGNGHDRHVHAHPHGHAHGAAPVDPSHDVSSSLDLVRQRIVSQVLELGIVVHSVVIGLSLGASESLDTIKPLLVALSFHQFFEGMGLGGCISQAKFRSLKTGIMMLGFCLTTPIGIGLGIWISSSYNENSPTALIVEGILNSASAGILIYMAMVDLLAADFTNPRMQANVRLQLGAYASLLLGAGFMSLLAIWA